MPFLYPILLIVLFCSCQAKTNQDKMNSYFTEKGVSGSTTIYNLKDDKWFYTDSIDAKRRTLPASTFKILNSLMLLEEGIVRDTLQVVVWDGEPKSFRGSRMKIWEKHTNMRQAFQNSTIWFYERLSQHIDRHEYVDLLRTIGYSNLRLAQDGDFWNYGAFGVSPEEQIRLLVQLYKEELPFQKNYQKIVKNLLKNKNVYAKSGWTVKDEINVGWWVGYLEIKDNVYFFATRIEEDDDEMDAKSFSKARKNITFRILKELGIQ